MNGLPKDIVWRSALIIASELIFILFPVGLTGLVIAMRADQGWRDFLGSPEWSFAATILAGQTGVKMFFGMSKAKGLKPAHVGFVGTALFMTSCAAMAILTFLMLTEGNPAAPHWPRVAQLILFAVAVAAFFLLGTLAHAWLELD